MRTTLKRGLARAVENGNSRALPPAALSPVTRYRQPEQPRRSGWTLVGQVLLWALASILMLCGGAAGGAYLFLHREVTRVQAHSAPVRSAARRLVLPVAHQPTIALLIGYDRRATDPKGSPSRSDTLMLVRADPQNGTLSLLSFPRDLIVNRICPGQATVQDRINSAYAVCGPTGTLETVKALTGLPVNYLITVNFHGFKDIVDRIGGVWLDIDRRYYNKNIGTLGTDYAGIDLQPGYQRLNGEQALDFVRFRHTDSDIYRTARQQLFVSALREQVRRTFSPFGVPGLIETLARNMEIGAAGDRAIPARTILSYALFAYHLAPGHVFRTQIAGLQPYGYQNAELITAAGNISTAVQDFLNPDVSAATRATDTALGTPPRARSARAPSPRQTTLLVLNGNGVTGSASVLGDLLGQRGYRVVLPPAGRPANAPSFDYFHSKVYFPAGKARLRGAAQTVAALIGSADVQPLPTRIQSFGAAVTVVVGSTFHGAIAPGPADRTPAHLAAAVAPEPQLSLPLLRDAQRLLPFRLELPTVLERTSIPDPEDPARTYTIDRGARALRLVYRTGSNEYWGIEETNWSKAPILAGPSLARRVGGRLFRLYYTGSHLHMVVLAQNGATYWVVNTLLDSLTNETLLAIAQGLRPLPR
jgi:LCP family protein required for cell wall assembly